MKSRVPQFLLLWLACVSYIAQASMGAGRVVCIDQLQAFAANAGQAAEAGSAERDRGCCSHDEAPPLVPVDRHDSESGCPCTDVSLYSDPGRVDHHTLEVPPLSQATALFAAIAFGAMSEQHQFDDGSARAHWQDVALAAPDAPRLRCVILII